MHAIALCLLKCNSIAFQHPPAPDIGDPRAGEFIVEPGAPEKITDLPMTGSRIVALFGRKVAVHHSSAFGRSRKSTCILAVRPTARQQAALPLAQCVVRYRDKDRIDGTA